MPRERIPADVERRVRESAHDRCGYCLSPQRLVMARLEILVSMVTPVLTTIAIALPRAVLL